jgi:hypothetical protein
LIRIHPQDESDLRWFHGREYEGQLGRRSNMGGIQDALERGAPCRLNAQVREAPDRARVVARLDGIERRVRVLPIAHRAMLSAAFGPAIYAGLECYGEYPGMLLASGAAAREHRASGTDRALAVWLARLAERVARAGEGRDEAVRPVVRLRRLAEDELAQALAAYGARVERPEPGAVSLRELARAAGQSPTTVSRALQGRGLAWARSRTGSAHAAGIDREQLQTLAPELARRLGERR